MIRKCVFMMWKFQDFSVAQILREIEVSKSGVSKICILTLLVALNYVFWTFQPLYCCTIIWNCQSRGTYFIPRGEAKIKIWLLWNCQMGILKLRIYQNWFHVKLNRWNNSWFSTQNAQWSNVKHLHTLAKFTSNQRNNYTHCGKIRNSFSMKKFVKSPL